jgi:ABC-2 type transport system permease protein
MKNVLTLTAVRMRLAMRNKAFFVFSVLMPILFLFFFAGVFGRGDSSRVAYSLAQVLSLTVMGSFWGLSTQLVMYREQGILRRFRLAPVTSWQLLGSSIISNYLLVLPTIVVEFALARWVFHMREWGNLFGAFILVSLGAVTFAAMGLIVASVTNTMQETQVICNVLWFGFIFLSGVTVPLPFLPWFVQNVAFFLPPTYLVNGLVNTIVKGTSVSSEGVEILALAICFVFGMVISAQLFRWEPEERLPGRAKLWASAAMIPFLLLGTWMLSFERQRSDAMRNFPAASQASPSAPSPEPPR